MKPAQTVIVANFGPANALWPECLAKSSIATFEDEDLRPFFDVDDRAGYIQHCLDYKKTVGGKSATRQTAATWYTIGTTIKSTQGDIWIHRDGDDLWWTTSTTEPALAELRPAVGLSNAVANVYVIHKPTKPWSKISIQWRCLHPKARDFLQKKQGTLGRLSDLNAQYALDLIHGKDLTTWHSQANWQSKALQTNFSPPKIFSSTKMVSMQMDDAAKRMASDALKTVENSNGQSSQRTVKNKESGFADIHAFTDYVLGLIKAQDGRCNLSGLPLQFDGGITDEELKASLDRIDSSGHYKEGNLQVVCRFINFWKNASDNKTFSRLIAKVKEVPAIQTPLKD